MPRPREREVMIEPAKCTVGLLLHVQRRGIPRDLREELAEERDDLRSLLDQDVLVHGYSGSANTIIMATCALGDYSLAARMCRYYRENGQGGIEYGSPGFYHAGPTGALLVALCDAREANDDEGAAAIAGYLRAVFALDALSALPFGRWHDLVVSGRPEGYEETHTPGQPGPSVAVAGNRWTPEERGIYTSENSHAELLGWALDLPGRQGLGKGRGVIAALLGARYDQTTPAMAWGLTEAERSTLARVVAGDVNAARAAAAWVYGVRTARKAEAWGVQILRTTLGVQSVFLGPWPNPNKPARACTQITMEGEHVGLQPSFRKLGAAAGYGVEIRDTEIWARTDQGGEHSIPALGGEMVWRLDIKGTDVRFSN